MSQNQDSQIELIKIELITGMVKDALVGVNKSSVCVEIRRWQVKLRNPLFDGVELRKAFVLLDKTAELEASRTAGTEQMNKAPEPSGEKMTNNILESATS